MTKTQINKGFRDTTMLGGLVRSTLIPHFSDFFDILDFPTWISADTKINNSCHSWAQNSSFFPLRIPLYNKALKQEKKMLERLVHWRNRAVHGRLSVQEIADRLNEEGFRTRRNTALTRQVLDSYIKRGVKLGTLPY